MLILILARARFRTKQFANGVQAREAIEFVSAPNGRRVRTALKLWQHYQTDVATRFTVVDVGVLLLGESEGESPTSMQQKERKALSTENEFVKIKCIIYSHFLMFQHFVFFLICQIGKNTTANCFKSTECTIGKIIQSFCNYFLCIYLNKL